MFKYLFNINSMRAGDKFLEDLQSSNEEKLEDLEDVYSSETPEEFSRKASKLKEKHQDNIVSPETNSPVEERISDAINSVSSTTEWGAIVVLTLIVVLIMIAMYALMRHRLRQRAMRKRVDEIEQEYQLALKKRLLKIDTTVLDDLKKEKEEKQKEIEKLEKKLFDSKKDTK